MIDPLADLSDGELRARLEARGVDPTSAEILVRRRDMPEVWEILVETLT